MPSHQPCDGQRSSDPQSTSAAPTTIASEALLSLGSFYNGSSAVVQRKEPINQRQIVELDEAVYVGSGANICSEMITTAMGSAGRQPTATLLLTAIEDAVRMMRAADMPHKVSITPEAPARWTQVMELNTGWNPVQSMYFPGPYPLDTAEKPLFTSTDKAVRVSFDDRPKLDFHTAKPREKKRPNTSSEHLVWLVLPPEDIGLGHSISNNGNPVPTDNCEAAMAVSQTTWFSLLHIFTRTSAQSPYSWLGLASWSNGISDKARDGHDTQADASASKGKGRQRRAARQVATNATRTIAQPKAASRRPFWLWCEAGANNGVRTLTPLMFKPQSEDSDKEIFLALTMHNSAHHSDASSRGKLMLCRPRADVDTLPDSVYWTYTAGHRFIGFMKHPSGVRRRSAEKRELEDDGVGTSMQNRTRRAHGQDSDDQQRGHKRVRRSSVDIPEVDRQDTAASTLADESITVTENLVMNDLAPDRYLMWKLLQQRTRSQLVAEEFLGMREIARSLYGDVGIPANIVSRLAELGWGRASENGEIEHVRPFGSYYWPDYDMARDYGHEGVSQPHLHTRLRAIAHRLGAMHGQEARRPDSALHHVQSYPLSDMRYLLQLCDGMRERLSDATATLAQQAQSWINGCDGLHISVQGVMERAIKLADMVQRDCTLGGFFIQCIKGINVENVGIDLMDDSRVVYLKNIDTERAFYESHSISVDKPVFYLCPLVELLFSASLGGYIRFDEMHALLYAPYQHAFVQAYEGHAAAPLACDDHRRHNYYASLFPDRLFRLLLHVHHLLHTLVWSVRREENLLWRMQASLDLDHAYFCQQQFTSEINLPSWKKQA